jgi:uncharacterized protein with HEPN domain/predicted nucleotidyltransferase
MNAMIEAKLPGFVRICQRYGIRRLELFGSAARDDFQPATSDLDLVAIFDESSYSGGFESYLKALSEFESLVGHKVDLLEADAITNPFLLEAIEQDRIVLCERRNGTVMARNPGTYLHDAAMALAAIKRYIAEKDLDDYLGDDLLQAAVERRFEITAEALNQLSKSYPSIAAKISALPAIIGFRNLLAHEYAAVNHRRVWELAQTRAPALRKELEALLQSLQNVEATPSYGTQKDNKENSGR